MYKNGCKTNLENYRPISLLPSISKIFEKLLATRIYSFFILNSVIQNKQYGFRKSHNSTHAILDIITEAFDNIENNKFSCVLALDLKKAFDTVNHKILLKKLDHYGIRGICYKLIQSYLSNRRQIVNFQNCFSSPKLITCGVPQGSILGPLLFLIYINDLTNALHSEPRLYADDTCLVVSNYSVKKLQTDCKEELQNAKMWMNLNKLTINISKSSALLIRPKIPGILNHSISLNLETIQLVDNIKYLGVEIDSFLNFKDQIHNLQSKISKGVGILFKLSKLVTSETLIILYYALIYPHLTYGITVWGSTFKSYFKPLQVLQNKAMRAIDNLNWKERVTPVYRKYKILKLNDIHKLEIAKFMYKFSKKSLPFTFNNYYKNIKICHDHDTRQSAQKDYFLTLHKTSRLQRSIKFLGIKVWNSIPTSIRNKSFKNFISNYKLYLIRNYN